VLLHSPHRSTTDLQEMCYTGDADHNCRDFHVMNCTEILVVESLVSGRSKCAKVGKIEIPCDTILSNVPTGSNSDLNVMDNFNRTFIGLV